MKTNIHIIKLLSLAALFFGTSCNQNKTSNSTETTKVIMCGSNMQHPPFSSFDNSGKAVGLEVDIVTAAAQKLGYEVKWLELDFGALIPAVEKGELALAVSTIGITETRKEKVQFSDSYFKTEIIALVNSSSSSSSLVSLSGKVIMADQGTTSYPAAQKQWPNTTIVSSNKETHWTELLENGKIDAFVVDASDIERIEKVYNVTFSRITEPISEEYFGIAINKTETELIKEINKVIANRNTTGENQKLSKRMSLIGTPLAQPSWKPETKQKLLLDLEIADAVFNSSFSSKFYN